MSSQNRAMAGVIALAFAAGSAFIPFSESSAKSSSTSSGARSGTSASPAARGAPGAAAAARGANGSRTAAAARSGMGAGAHGKMAQQHASSGGGTGGGGRGGGSYLPPSSSHPVPPTPYTSISSPASPYSAANAYPYWFYYGIHPAANTVNRDKAGSQAAATQMAGTENIIPVSPACVFTKLMAQGWDAGTDPDALAGELAEITGTAEFRSGTAREGASLRERRMTAAALDCL